MKSTSICYLLEDYCFDEKFKLVEELLSLYDFSDIPRYYQDLLFLTHAKRTLKSFVQSRDVASGHLNEIRKSIENISVESRKDKTKELEEELRINMFLASGVLDELIKPGDDDKAETWQRALQKLKDIWGDEAAASRVHAKIETCLNAKKRYKKLRSKLDKRHTWERFVRKFIEQIMRFGKKKKLTPPSTLRKIYLLQQNLEHPHDNEPQNEAQSISNEEDVQKSQDEPTEIAGEQNGQIEVGESKELMEEETEVDQDSSQEHHVNSSSQEGSQNRDGYPEPITQAFDDSETESQDEDVDVVLETPQSPPENAVPSEDNENRNEQEPPNDASWNAKSLPIPPCVSVETLREELTKRNVSHNGSRRRLVTRLSELLMKESSKEEAEVVIKPEPDEEPSENSPDPDPITKLANDRGYKLSRMSSSSSSSSSKHTSTSPSTNSNSPKQTSQNSSRKRKATVSLQSSRSLTRSSSSSAVPHPSSSAAPRSSSSSQRSSSSTQQSPSSARQSSSSTSSRRSLPRLSSEVSDREDKSKRKDIKSGAKKKGKRKKHRDVDHGNGNVEIKQESQHNGVFEYHPPGEMPSSQSSLDEPRQKKKHKSSKHSLKSRKEKRKSRGRELHQRNASSGNDRKNIISRSHGRGRKANDSPARNGVQHRFDSDSSENIPWPRPHKSIKRSPNKRRQKFAWKEPEVNAFVQGLKKHGVGNWAQIMEDPDITKHFHESRDNMKLKDKYRTMMRNNQIPPELM